MSEESDASRQGRLNRDKGKRFERQVAKDLKKIFGDHLHRGFQSRAGSDEADIEKIPGVWVECKNWKTPQVRQAMIQAKGDVAKSDREWNWIFLFIRYSADLMPTGRRGAKEALKLFFCTRVSPGLSPVAPGVKVNSQKVRRVFMDPMNKHLKALVEGYDYPVYCMTYREAMVWIDQNKGLFSV
jgi:hypothetical protein